MFQVKKNFKNHSKILLQHFFMAAIFKYVKIIKCISEP